MSTGADARAVVPTDDTAVLKTSPAAAPSVPDVPPLPASPMKRRRQASSGARRVQRTPQQAAPSAHTQRTLSTSNVAVPHYVVPTVAAVAHRRAGAYLDAERKPRATPATTSGSSEIVAADKSTDSPPHDPQTAQTRKEETAPSAPLNYATEMSLLEEVLDAQLCATSSPPPTTTTGVVGESEVRAVTPTLVDEAEMKTQKQINGISIAAEGAPHSTQLRTTRRQQRRKTEVGASFSSRRSRAETRRAPPLQRPLSSLTSSSPEHVGFDNQRKIEKDLIIDADADPTELHTTLRLRPFPSTIAASAKVASALADALGSTGVDGELMDGLLEPTRPTQTSAQAALAAARASLLYDGPDIHKVHRGKLTTSMDVAYGPSSTPRLRRGKDSGVVATYITQAVIGDFLKTEADAEAAEHQQQNRHHEANQEHQTSVNEPKSTVEGTVEARRTSSSPSSSTQTGSAAVLSELQTMQRRLHAQRCETSPQQNGYASSPCDISASTSSSASSLLSSTSSAATMDVSTRCRARRNVADWATASVTEIVEAVDRGVSFSSSSALPSSLRLRHSHRSNEETAAPWSRRHRKKSTEFEPEVYVHALLEGNVGNYDDDDELLSPYTLPFFDEPPNKATNEAASGLRKSALSSPSPVMNADASVPSQSFSIPQELRREALWRAGPSWAAAAAEVGLTPREVQELLQYSLSAPEAATWLSMRQPTNDDPQKSVSSNSKWHRKKSGSEDQQHQLLSCALDAATQTALVHRIVTALPAVPAVLKEEMAAQRRLLERVAHEVTTATAPLHSAIRERLASPTATSFARQPAWIELQTSDILANTVKYNRTTSNEKDQERTYEAQLIASLPKPAMHALAAVAGLNDVAADPSRSLPPFHSVIARPPLSSFAPPASPQRPQESSESVLHALAEHEAQHYVHELDRLRATYDRQLHDERRQRGQERQAYAVLLERQQQQMLQHHRETIRVLQREARLQQQQQDSLVQQLAASQAAEAQRRQDEQGRAARRMLSGAVEAMKSHCVTAAAMDAYIGRQRQQHGALKRTAAEKLSRAQRIRERTEATAAKEATHKLSHPLSLRPPPSPSLVLTPKETSTANTLVGQSSSTVAAAHTSQAPVRARRPVVRVEAPGEGEITEATTSEPGKEPSEEPLALHADIPTAGHLTPLRRTREGQQLPSQPSTSAGIASMKSATAGVDRAPISSPATEGCAEAERKEKATMRSARSETASSSLSDNTHTQPDTQVGSPEKTSTADRRNSPSSSSPPSSSASKLQLNSADVLCAVYSEARHPPQKYEAGAAHKSITTVPPQQRRPRMVFPLQVNLLPEDELDVYVRRVDAAKAAVDTRAVEAAQKEKLVAGTKLYAATKGPSSSLPRPAVQGNKRTLTSSGKVTRSGTAPLIRRGALATSSSLAVASLPQPRSRTTPAGGGAGRIRGGRPRQQQRLLQSSKQTSRASVGPSHSGTFDVEVVAALTGELEPMMSQPGHATSHLPYASPYPLSPPTSYGMAAQEQSQSLSPFYRGAWSERILTQEQRDAVQEQLPLSTRADAAITAGKPCVGPPVLVLSDPVVFDPTSTVEMVKKKEKSPHGTTTSAAAVLPSISGATSAARHTQILNAQLRSAQHERDRVIAELREAAERVESQRREPSFQGNTDAVVGVIETKTTAPSSSPTAAVRSPSPSSSSSSAATACQVVGSLPPCEAAFFGAPADILITDDNNSDRTDPLYGTDGLIGSSSVTAAASSSTSWATDYARAWGRFEQAARDVESAAAAVATEDAGVLEAVAREHHRRSGRHHPSSFTRTAVQGPRFVSTSAGVRYREQQFGGTTDQKGFGGKEMRSGGGVHVSAKMADKARALTAARHRLAQIRACFVAPPSFGSNTSAQIGGALTAAAVMHPDAATTAGMDAAALMRRLTEETVLSLFEVAGSAQRDPVRQVVAAMEHELLRLVLEDELTRNRDSDNRTHDDDGAAQKSSAEDGATAAKKAAKMAVPVAREDIDPQLLHALVEAILEEAVQTALQRQAVVSNATANITNTHRQQNQQHASLKEGEREAIARALKRCAEGMTNLTVPIAVVTGGEETQRERITLPVVSSTAWLHDAQVTSAAADNAVVLSSSSKKDKEHESKLQNDALATATIVVPLQDTTTGSVATAEGSAISSQELRIVLDLSPVARHLLSPPNSVAAAIAVPCQWDARSYLPVQQEQLPSRRMLLEDRRDVIVEAEARPPRRQEADTGSKTKVQGVTEELLLPVLPSLPSTKGTERVEGTSADAAREVHEREEEKDQQQQQQQQLPLPSTAASVALQTGGVAPSVLSVPPPPPVSPFVQMSSSPTSFVVVSSPFTSAAATAPTAPQPTAFPTPFELRNSDSTHHTTAAQLAVSESTSSTTHFVAATSTLLRMLLSNFVDQEARQRSALADREEEQRQSLWRLRDVVARDFHRSIVRVEKTSTTPQATPVVDTAISTQRAKEALSTPPSISHSTAAEGASAEPPPQPPHPLPPVRDPVMSAVLEWVYQFGASPKVLRQQQQHRAGRTVPAAASDLVRQLNSAAATAAAAVEESTKGPAAAALHPGDAGWVDVCSGRQHLRSPQQLPVCVLAPPQRRAPASLSQPSSRNLGSGGASSATSDTSSSLSSSASLPSSLKTFSSSSLTEKSWAKNIVRTERQAHVVARARPVLDTHSFPFRRDGSAQRTTMMTKKAEDGSSDAATTRYTTSASSDDQRERRTLQISSTHAPSPLSHNGGSISMSRAAEARTANAMASAALPRWVSAEVQDALAAALRAHRHVSVATSDAEQKQQRNPMLSISDVGADTSAAEWPDSSQYAVTLPARSAECTQITTPPPSAAYALKERKSSSAGNQRQTLRSPQRSPGKEASTTLPHSSFPARHHRREIPLKRPPAAWDAYSLTSTSTSTHSTDREREKVERHSDDVAVCVARPPAATSALPFLERNNNIIVNSSIAAAATATTPPPVTISATLTSPPPGLSVSSVRLPFAQSSTQQQSPPHQSGQPMSPALPSSGSALQEEVLRVQREQRSGGK